MRLERVAGRFDKTPMWDAYTGRKLAAKCQVTSWDMPRRDGMTTIRRTLFMSEGSKLPNRSAVIIGGGVWIISSLRNPDTWGTHVSRKGYVAQYAKLGVVADTAQVLSNTGIDVYLSRTWVKDTKDIVNSSDGQGQYYIYYVSGEPVKEGEFVYSEGRWHIVRNIITGTAGLMIAECNELEPDCVVDVLVVGTGEYDPVTETYSHAAQTPFKAIQLDWRDDYHHQLPSYEKEQVGDSRLRVPQAASRLITMSSRLAVKGLTYQVVGIEPRDNGALSVAVRRV